MRVNTDILGVVKRNPLFLHEIKWKNNGFLFTTPNISISGQKTPTLNNSDIIFYFTKRKEQFYHHNSNDAIYQLCNVVLVIQKLDTTFPL